MFTQFRKYSPNSKCRPSSCILVVLAMFFGKQFGHYFLFRESSEMFCPLVLHSQLNAILSAGPLSCLPFFCYLCCAIDVIFHTANFKRLPTLANASWLQPGFHMLGKSQTIGDFTVSRLSQIFPTNENSKSQISPIVWDGRGQFWRIGSVSIFPTRPTFLRWSAIISDK